MTNVEEQRPGFWARQFAPEVTPAQNVFDAFFGIVLPVVCLWADPMVFKGSDVMGGGVLGHYALPAYLFIGAAALSLTLWLLVRRLAILLAGPFFIAALVALGVGVALLPLSLIGLVAVIGALGLVPFGTALVFLRNGVRATRLAQERRSTGTVAAIALLAAGLAIALPTGAHVFVHRRVAWALDQAIASDPGRQEAAFSILRRYAPLMRGNRGLDRVVWRWNREADPARKARIATAYELATGVSIEWRFYELND